MHGIYPMAVLTTGVALVFFGVTLHKIRLPANERLLWLVMLVALPLQPLAFYLVRVPLDNWLVGYLGSSSETYAWLKTFYAPLTEELAKLVPLLLPAVFRDIRRENFVRYALAIGVGFAVGEMWFVAERVARVPSFAALPPWQFTGYMGERLMTCVFHTSFVSVALWQLRRRFALGLAGAVALHWLGNSPIFLMAWNVGGLGKTFWMAFMFFFLLLYFLAALALLSYFAFGRVAPARIFYGPRHCPECGADYDAPLLALSFFHTRYERCPNCRHWHWTSSRKD